jgi:putative two-component system response regulator
LSARIVKLADVFDALTTKRPYKEPWSIQAALELIDSQTGASFDPKIVQEFKNLFANGTLTKIKETYN